MLTILINKLKSLILFFATVFRRALCCFRRRRRSSTDSVPLTHVGVVSERTDCPENWNWEDRLEYAEPKTVQDHIELYRKRKLDAQQADEMTHQEEHQHLFDDMTPNITKQTKVLITADECDNSFTNRLNVLETVPVGTGELREWEDNSGWEGDTLDWDAQAALREKKRIDRERKLWEQQQKRQEKTNKSLGARVST